MPHQTHPHRPTASAALAAVILLLSACGSDDDGSADSAPSAGTEDVGSAPSGSNAPGSSTAATGETGTTPPGSSACPEGPGGDLTMGTGNLAAGIDPTVALGTGSSGGTELMAFYDTLMRWIPDTDEYVPHMAESLSSNDDLTTWTLTLREGLTFGNGNPVTAEAVQFSIERLAASSRSAAGLAQEFTGFEIVDDRTITFTMDSPNGTVPYSLATEVGMVVDPSVVDERGDSFAVDPAGAGAGPFEIERFAPGEEILFTPKDDYWGGDVCLDSLRFVNIAGGDGTWDAFRAGELDVAFLSDMTVINAAREAGAEAHTQISGGNGFLMLNNREGAATADPRVRHAVSLAIDTEVINDRASDGEGLPTSCLAHPDQVIHPDVECPPHDPEAARALVEEAKADGWDGSINLVFRDTTRAADVSIALEAMLTDVGMTVTRENLTTAAWAEKVLAPPYQFDVGDYGLALLDTGPIARMNQFFSDSVRNRSGYASDDMDAALSSLEVAASPDQIVTAMAEIQTMWNADIPSIVYDASEWFIAAQEPVEGLIFTRDVTVMFQDAYIAE